MYSVIQQSLQMALWVHHQSRLKDSVIQETRRYVTMAAWWKEMGAFIWTAQRQVGKTTFLKELWEKLEKQNENVLAINHKNFQRVRFTGLNHADTNLLVDEFDYIINLNEILSYPWKSVTMVGTLR